MIFSRLALLLFFAQTPPSSIHGIVVRGTDGMPLSKAVVELRAAEGNPAADYQTITNSEGRFAFPDVSPGRYNLTTSRAGYVRREYPSVVTVGAGQQITDMRLTLVATGAIFGRVFDQNGSPIGNTTVTAFKAAYRDGQRTLKVEQIAVTNDLGEYRLFWLPPGSYFIGAKPRSGEHVPGPLASGEGPENTAGLMIGILNAPALPGFPVSDSISSILKKAEGSSDAQETFVTTYFPGTTNHDQASAIEVRPGSEIGGADLTITAARTHHIRGIIVNRVTGLPAHAQLRKARLSELEACTSGAGRERRENCSFEPVDYDKATFDIPMVTPGAYVLYSTSGNLIAKTTVDVADTDIDNVVLTLRPGITLAGRILPAVADVKVTLSPGPPLSDAPLAGTSLPDGTFSIHDLTPGDYSIRVGVKDGFIQSIKMGEEDVLSSGLHVREDQNPQIDIHIATDGGVVEGRVVNARGEAALNVTATLLPVALPRRVDLYRTAQTDDSGHYRFSNVAPGDYKLFSWGEIETGAWQNADFMRAYDQEGTPLHVGQGSRLNIDTTLVSTSVYPR
jgi:protocatechuate 3,4-dioxygenase beta subunit